MQEIVVFRQIVILGFKGRNMEQYYRLNRIITTYFVVSYLLISLHNVLYNTGCEYKRENKTHLLIVKNPKQHAGSSSFTKCLPAWVKVGTDGSAQRVSEDVGSWLINSSRTLMLSHYRAAGVRGVRQTESSEIKLLRELVCVWTETHTHSRRWEKSKLSVKGMQSAGWWSEI